MSEQDFIEAVRVERDSSDAEAFLCLIKQAGVADSVKNTAQFLASRTLKVVREHPHEVALGLLGAASLAGGQYLATKPGKNGRSADQDQASWAVKTTKNSIDKDLKAGRDPGFSKEMAHAVAQGGEGVSKVMSKHPGKAALIMVPTGASLGLAAAALLKSQIFK